MVDLEHSPKTGTMSPTTSTDRVSVTPRVQDPPAPPLSASTTSSPTTAEQLIAVPARLDALRDEPTTAQRLADTPILAAPDSAAHAPLAAGVFQDLSYKVPNNFSGTDGKPNRFELTFRDRSGFPNPTSHAYLNRTSLAPGSSWKGLRLDHGPNPASGGATNWHWNHKGAGGFGIPDHTVATRFESGVGRAALVVGAALDGYSLAKQVNISRQTGDWGNTAQESARIAGGWTGAIVGAKAAGSVGAAIGTLIAPGIGTVVGGAVGGFERWRNDRWLVQVRPARHTHRHGPQRRHCLDRAQHRAAVSRRANPWGTHSAARADRLRP